MLMIEPRSAVTRYTSARSPGAPRDLPRTHTLSASVDATSVFPRAAPTPYAATMATRSRPLMAAKACSIVRHCVAIRIPVARSDASRSVRMLSEKSMIIPSMTTSAVQQRNASYARDARGGVECGTTRASAKSRGCLFRMSGRASISTRLPTARGSSASRAATRAPA